MPAHSPDINPNEHLWEELEGRLHSRPPHPAVPDYTKALVADGANPHSHALKSIAKSFEKSGAS